MSAVAEASPSIRARDNLSALGFHEMAASLPDYVRMASAGERDFCSALEEMTRVEVAPARRGSSASAYAPRASPT